MAEATSVSVTSVQRIWRTRALKPHRVRQFKLPKDPEFVDKLLESISPRGNLCKRLVEPVEDALVEPGARA